MSDKPKTRTERRRVQREQKSNERDAAKVATRKERRIDREMRGGVIARESLDGKSQSPAQLARSRAAQRAGDNRKAQAGRTRGRDEHLGGKGKSEADKARGRASARAQQDKAAQADRTQGRGKTSEADQARNRADVRASNDALYRKARTNGRDEGVRGNGKSEADKARGRAAGSAKEDRQAQAERTKGSPEQKAKQEKARQEAEAKKAQAEQKAKELEAKAKSERDKASKLTGKARREAFQGVAALELQAKQARDQVKEADKGVSRNSDPQQDHVDGPDKSAAAQSRERAAQRAHDRQDHLTPRTVTARSVLISDIPQSAPPTVSRSATSMTRICTTQAWEQLDAEMGMMA